MGEAAPDGTYAEFNQAVARVTVESYEGALGRLGGGPETVARSIEKAIVTRRPKTRYTVTPSARLILTQRKLFSDRMWDRFVGTSFPRPGA